MEVAFLLSGEHSEIPREEVKATLEALNTPYLTIEEMRSCLILDIELSKDLEKELSERLSFTRSFGRVLAIIHASEFPEALSRFEPPNVTGRFRVSSTRVEGCCKHIRRYELESKLGEWILEANEGAEVDLENPDIEVIAVLTSDHIVVYLKESEVDRSMFKVKEVAARPYVHPASMRPTLARAMVNLARTRKGDEVLDPFLGVGGIALEALSIGAKLIGVDIDEKIVIQANNNIIAYGFFEGYHLYVGDALKLELEGKVDRIVTDPPYGRMSSSHGCTPKELVLNFVRRIPDYLRSGGWFAISVPADFLSHKEFEEIGIDIVNEFDVREHRSLTRRIWVGKLK
ncbi:MAG: DNA methyltransferase [Candidatus Korarchaeum sp.]|nr:DNA methyltransferase [Candidatus Korarchaeum sp.]MDW8036220.1 DNA methyltransferase [Candidatus Korarchaeum sp.]